MTQHRVTLRPGADLAGFRNAVRVLLAGDVPPHDVAWNSAPGLLGHAVAGRALPVLLPRMAHALIRDIVCHGKPA